MSKDLRNLISTSKRIVVKIGSSSITTAQGGIDEQKLNQIVKAIAAHHKKAHEIVLVSSGAIAAGLAPLKLDSRPKDLTLQQAVASVGQSLLVNKYSQEFSKHGINVGQVLLTAEDMSRRSHYRNAQRTFNKLLEMKVIPIVNENDTVANDEIRVGDNDRLAGIVTHLIDADALILLSDVDGLYTAPPGNTNSKLITEVKDFTEINNLEIGGAGASGVGTGGMFTKVQAARISSAGGVAVLITDAKNLDAVLDGKNVGTIFWPKKAKLSARSLWIAHAADIEGQIKVDQGAAKALLTKQASLLSAGIKEIYGDFEDGAVVEVIDENQKVIAKGLIKFDSTELPKMIGKNSSKLLEEFGEGYEKEVIHRDDLVLSSDIVVDN
ncbi:MAG: glutamate 5-kinase [Actinobacteria bacterium]|nr:glutamate 5-kinase [Actinomycetota bacterium]